MAIKRILEPEVMESDEDARDYNAMDHADVNRLFVDDLLAAGFMGGDVLDLGTGTALIPVELCRRVENCRVMAVDAAVSMLDLARFNVEAAGLIERIELQQVDAKNMGYADGMFDVVVSNSIVHHIPDPIECLREAVRVTRPGGTLFFRDLLRPASEQELGQLVQTYTGEENEHSQQMFAESLHAALALEEVRDLIQSLGFDPAGVDQNSDRHWTWHGIKAE
ncbi:MAG: class I SAM-dependent methyltransferase [Pirellulaceae bacterium]